MNIDDLLKENRFLKEENQKLRELLKGYGYIFDDIIKLNALEKIKMYRSYFRGRDDIFARYYHDIILNHFIFLVTIEIKRICVILKMEERNALNVIMQILLL